MIKSKEDGSVEASLPEALYQAIVRIQAEKSLDWKGGCTRAAELIDSGSESFKKDVRNEALRLHRKELISELNKGRHAIEQNAFQRALERLCIRYPCPTCGKDMIWDPSNENDKRDIMSLLRRGGIDNWHHTGCKPLTR